MNAVLFYKKWSELAGKCVVTDASDPLVKQCSLAVSRPPDEATIAALAKQMLTDTGKHFMYKGTVVGQATGVQYATFVKSLIVETNIVV